MELVLPKLNNLIYFLVATERGFNNGPTYSIFLQPPYVTLLAAKCVVAKKAAEFGNYKLKFCKQMAQENQIKRNNYVAETEKRKGRKK